jgi:hypothetical protein
MIVLNTGARGAEVLLLQRLLNKRGASPQLVEDADFGRHTLQAAIAFQSANHILPANGVVNPATWSRLGVTVELEHRVTLFGQPTGMTCWSAAATMILGNMSVGSGAAQTDTTGGLNPDIDNIETFLAGLGWRLLNNQSAPPISTFINGLSVGPLWVAFEGGTFKHAVVASAIWGDRTDDGTVMRIHDPWPPGRGTLYGTTYTDRRVRLKSVTPPRLAMVQFVASSR